MKYLSTILETNEIDGQHREAATASYLAAKERMRKLPVDFGEDAEMMLSNHLMALIKRISENKFIDPIEEEMMNELSDRAWDYAKQVAEPLCGEAGIEPDRSEIFLVGTHMEMALAAMAAGVQ